MLEGSMHKTLWLTVCVASAGTETTHSKLHTLEKIHCIHLGRAPNCRERASAARSWREPAGEKLGWSKGGWRSQPPASWRRAGARLAGGASRLPAAAQQPTSFCFCNDDRKWRDLQQIK